MDVPPATQPPPPRLGPRTVRQQLSTYLETGQMETQPLLGETAASESQIENAVGGGLRSNRRKNSTLRRCGNSIRHYLWLCFAICMTFLYWASWPIRRPLMWCCKGCSGFCSLALCCRFACSSLICFVIIFIIAIWSDHSTREIIDDELRNRYNITPPSLWYRSTDNSMAAVAGVCLDGDEEAAMSAANLTEFDDIVSIIDRQVSNDNVLFCGVGGDAILDRHPMWANKYHISTGADFLEELGDKLCHVGGGFRNCARISCKVNAGIWLCSNYPGQGFAIPCGELAQYPRYMLEHCMVKEVGIKATLWVKNHPGVGQDFNILVGRPKHDCWG